jgi:hypothetical protein
VADVLNGYNCSLMAYGQTGSGKTHTMMGEVSTKLSLIGHGGPSGLCDTAKLDVRGRDSDRHLVHW